MPILTPRFAAACALITAAAGVLAAQPALATTVPTPPAAVTTIKPVRVVPATTTRLDATGHAWAPDAPYAHGGSYLTTTNTISHSYSSTLYKAIRRNPTGYSFPVAQPGTYFVDLFVAEISNIKPGQRVWDVTAEGKTAVANVDVVREAGQNRAWHVLFSAPVTDGVLDLGIVARAGLPLIDSIEVDYQGPQTSATTLFSDDFDGDAGTSPDAGRWGYDVGGGGWGNHELETYTDRPENASVDGSGNLAVSARPETFTGTDGITRNYTSARLSTASTFAFTYGTAQARIRTPKGKGLWPAFWALGSDMPLVGWPNCGELDVMETVGSTPNTAYQNIHGTLKTGPEWSLGTSAVLSSALSAGYHTYGLVWGPNALAITVDGRAYMTTSATDVAPANLWTFNHSFYLLIDLAVGGSWPGSPDSTTPFPAVMSVDYVHVTS